MIVSINQPAYLPWLGYFHRIAASDVHVILDHVQFEKNSFTNRNRIRTREGTCWLTVPLKTKGQFGDLAINRIEIAGETPWPRKHLASLAMNYARAPHFAAHRPFFEELFARPWVQLNDLLDFSTGYLLRALGIGTRLVRSSELGVAGTKSDLVLDICRTLGATTYVSGALGRDYLDEAPFAEAGIRVAYQDYRHPEYPQVFPGFESFLSVVDLLFNCGPGSLEAIMKDQERYT